VKLRAQIRVLRLEAALLQRRVQLVKQLLELEGLRDETLGSLPRDLHRLADGAKTGDDDGDDFGVPGERFLQHPSAIDAGQPQICDQDVEGKIAEPRERLFSRSGLLDAEFVFSQTLRHDLTKSGLVVHEQQVQRCIAHEATAF
jgi:hypothetical protein